MRVGVQQLADTPKALHPGAKVPVAFLTKTVTGKEQDVSCNLTSVQMTMKPQVMDQSQSYR